MKEVLRSMYDAYGLTDKSGMSFFSDFRSQLSEFDPTSLIVAQMKGYPHRYVLDFLLACPFVWAELRSQEWKELMRRSSPRPDPRTSKEELSEFCDIEFLQRILRIDALRVFLEDTAVASEDKEFTGSYFLKSPRLLLADPEELVDFDGSYFVSADQINEVRNAILREGDFKPVQE